MVNPIFSMLFFYIEIYWGKAIEAYTRPQQWKKEEIERLREGDQITFIDLRFERWLAVGFRKAGKQDVP